jgi:hypothetical protein
MYMSFAADEFCILYSVYSVHIFWVFVYFIQQQQEIFSLVILYMKYRTAAVSKESISTVICASAYRPVLWLRIRDPGSGAFFNPRIRDG